MQKEKTICVPTDNYFNGKKCSSTLKNALFNLRCKREIRKAKWYGYKIKRFVSFDSLERKPLQLSLL